jgi:putative peptide modification system cyclase
MNLSVSPPPRSAAGSPVTPVLRAVLLADLADSTAFVQRFGDARAAAALQRLDLQIRDLLAFTGGQLIDKADGLLALFERPVQAVDFALRYQQALRQFSVDEGAPLAARVGIHVGELMTWANTEQDVRAGAKPLEVEGLAKPVAARLMALALPGQILVSSMAQSLAQRAQSELGERADRVKWVSHGRYRFKGVPAPILVHEVGEVGASPLKQPPSGHKVWRELPLWRRPPVLAAELLVFLAVVGFYGYSLLKSPPALAFQQRDWVVVGDLSNFTGDTRLEDSLDTALRVGLEQSRYVNLVPELKVQSVLKRMGRGGEATVDRAVGSEIALREGAKALLLPSVAEVGGRLRVSLEVVDPTTQVTVYADSEDGRGIDSALASLDALNGRLRERLGESLGDIQANGKPLAQITTPSLEALRLYTLANEAAIQHYKFDESLRLLNLALREDPEFALAYSSRARLRLADSDFVRAKQDFALANRFRSRLSTREALILDSGLSEFGPVQNRIDIYRTFSRIYPDTYRAYFQVAYNMAFYQQKYEQALVELKPAMTPQNPRFAGVLHMAGLLNLAMEKVPEAKVAFERAESLGSRDPVRYHAYVFAMLRQYDRAKQLLETQGKTGFAGADMDARLPEITYPVDQGEWKQALAAADRLAKESAGSAPLQSRTYHGTWLGLRTYESAPVSELRTFATTELNRALLPGDPEVVSSTFAALYAGAMLARTGDAGAARAILDSLQARVPALGYPALDDMLAVLRAELALQAKDTKTALAVLRPRLTGGELGWVHALLLRVYRQDGSVADASREAEWLATHRGRAYVEWNSQYLLQPLNVLESNLALLSMAEIARDSGDAATAGRQLQRFKSAWKNPPAFVAGRVLSVEQWVSQNTYQTGQK